MNVRMIFENYENSISLSLNFFLDEI